MTDDTILLPGQQIGQPPSNHLGNGTHIQGTQLFASVAGPKLSTPATATSKPNPKSNPAISIARPAGPLLPDVNTIVLGKITRTLPRQATLSILALQPSLESPPHTLNEPLPALIRQQDIRLTEVDKVKVNEMFRVGDVVRAVVISLGDERSYYCSTARNELGVVMARCESTGNAMVPVSWREFMDPETGVREGRKVAKVV